VARDVHSLDSLGAVADGARDYWFVGAWAPAGAAAALRQQARTAGPAPAPHAAAPVPAPPREAPAAEPKGLRPTPAVDTTARLWVQVSASQSEAASRALVAELSSTHKLVQLVPPRAEGDGWRVVLGPFGTRDEAEAAGRALGRPFFIVERAAPEPGHP
jgi:hypothetical protein